MAKITFQALDQDGKELIAEVLVDGRLIGRTTVRHELAVGHHVAVFKATKTHNAEQPEHPFEVSHGETTGEVKARYRITLKVDPIGSKILGEPLTISGKADPGSQYDGKAVYVDVKDDWGGSERNPMVGPNGDWAKTWTGPSTPGSYSVAVSCHGETITVTITFRARGR